LNPSKRGFSEFLDAAHILTQNCDEMAGDRPRQPGMKFSAPNADFISPSPAPLSSRRPVKNWLKMK